MQRNELLCHGDTIVRVLETREDNVLFIPCLRKSMPLWAKQAKFADYQSCSDADLQEITGISLPYLDDLPSTDRRIAHERYTMIAGILPFVGEYKRRAEVIERIAADRGISKQTIRKYLCLFLVHQNLTALAPKQKSEERILTQDEKNIRWALNKYFYTRHKNSLTTAYTLMLKERYCDGSGQLLPEYPSIHQFKYFYRKHKKLQTFYISRNGLKDYQRNNRPLLGDGVQEFAPNVGTAMLDSTICDIYLVDEAGNLVGRPLLTACIDAYSGLCCGYTLTWEGGVYSLQELMSNVIADKVEWCRRFGISITREEWNCDKLPGILVTDMGSEYKSANFEQIAELGVTVINLPSYRPELKGVVEKFFDLVQEAYKKHLKGRGVIEPDFQERGAHDYRRDACLTMDAFERIVVRCVIYHNSKRVVENFPFTLEMLSQKVSPNPSAIWNWGLSELGANLISVDQDMLVLTLLPRTKGKFSRRGLTVNRLRYRNEDYTEDYLKGGGAIVTYDPDDVSCVWLLENGEYIPFSLIESRFSGMDLGEVLSVKNDQQTLIRDAAEDNLQAQIDLANHIEAIAHSVQRLDCANIKGIRSTRQKEQTKARMKGGRNHD